MRFGRESGEHEEGRPNQKEEVREEKRREEEGFLAEGFEEGRKSLLIAGKPWIRLYWIPIKRRRRLHPLIFLLFFYVCVGPNWSAQKGWVLH